MRFLEIDGKFSPQKTLFLFLLFVWTGSTFFMNAVYQISWVALNLYFFWHIFWYKNFDLIRQILPKIRFLTLCACALFIVICIANLLNTQYLSKKSWETTIFMILRFGTIFLALCYFYKLEYFDRRDILTAVFIGLGLLVIGGIYELATNPAAMTDVNKGVTGFLRNRNGFGLFMGFGVVASLAFIRQEALKFIIASIFAFFMIFSFSRSSWVACFGASVILGALNLKQFRWQYLLYALIFLIFLVALYFSFDSFGQRLEKLLQGNSTHRDFIWKYSLDMIVQNPIIGYGLDTFRDLPNSPALQRHDFNATHNMLLEILLYTGVIGFVFYTAIVLNLLKTAFASRDFAVLAVFCYFLLVCQFDYGAYMSKSILSLIVIFAFLAYSHRIKA